MTKGTSGIRLRQRLIDRLYTEAMLMADEARSYFDEAGRGERDGLAPLSRVTFSCESLKVTTRLMHVIAWLLTQRALIAGELKPRDAIEPARRLGEAPASDAAATDRLPPGALALVRASEDLHRRVARLDAAQISPPVRAEGPVRALQDRLALSF